MIYLELRLQSPLNEFSHSRTTSSSSSPPHCAWCASIDSHRTFLSFGGDLETVRSRWRIDECPTTYRYVWSVSTSPCGRRLIVYFVSALLLLPLVLGLGVGVESDDDLVLHFSDLQHGRAVWIVDESTLPWIGSYDYLRSVISRVPIRASCEALARPGSIVARKINLVGVGTRRSSHGAMSFVLVFFPSTSPLPAISFLLPFWKCKVEVYKRNNTPYLTFATRRGKSIGFFGTS